MNLFHLFSKPPTEKTQAETDLEEAKEKKRKARESSRQAREELHQIHAKQAKVLDKLARAECELDDSGELDIVPLIEDFEPDGTGTEG